MDLKKADNHQYYWIKKEKLFESFKNAKGVSYSRKIMKVAGMMDEDRCSEACIKYIEVEFIN
jgi:hypothetical protein